MSFLTHIFMASNGRGPWGGKPSGGGPRNPRPTGPSGDQPDIDDLIRNAHNKVRSAMGGGGNSGGNGGIIGLVLAAGVLVWLASGFYIVAPDEQGVVLRFGKYVGTKGPGPNYHLPYPIEAVIKPKVTRENIVEVGMRSQASMNAMFANRRFNQTRQLGTSDIPAESLMLTGDENIVDLDFTVRWKIMDPRDYLFNVENPNDAIKNIAESAMREVIGKRPIDDALTGNKQLIQDEAGALIQQVADYYRLGVLIKGVELQQVNPPSAVIDAFRDVQAARADAEKAQNEARGYANDILPRARGEAAQILQDAEAYKASKIAEATGAANRFESQLEEYRKARTITAKRLYLETMESVLKDARKVLISGEAGKGVLPYLPLNERKGGK